MSDFHEDYQAASLKYQNQQEINDFNLFSMLKPKLTMDGDKWCVLYGENLQEGIAGFGDSPHQAILNFNSEWYKKGGEL